MSTSNIVQQSQPENNIETLKIGSVFMHWISGIYTPCTISKIECINSFNQESLETFSKVYAVTLRHEKVSWAGISKTVTRTVLKNTQKIILAL